MSSVEVVTTNGIEVRTPPSGPGCVECEEAGGWWVHFRETGHAVIQSFEPGESWFWDYVKEKGVIGPELAPPTARPDDQPVPGPAGRVPDDWRERVNH